MIDLETPTQVRGAIRAHERVASDAGILTIAASAVPRYAPGQFFQLRAGEALDPLLGRPFSILDQSAPGAADPWLSVLYQVHGRATARLATLRAGDTVTCVGPLGRPFALPRRPGPAIVVAGGVGIPPFLLLTRAWVAAGREVVVLLGARDAEHLYLRDDLSAEGAEVRCATEDGSVGHRGRVTELLEHELSAREAVGAVYACGPEGMLRAVVEVARRHDAPGQVSMERMMACGYGVCFTCVCRLRKGDGGFGNTRTCIEGPVIDLDRLPSDGAW